MRVMIAFVFLVASAGIAAAADDTAACQARQVEVSKQEQAYHGDPMMKKLIQADLKRSNQELIEGDADECMEALDHATKLLSGKM